MKIDGWFKLRVKRNLLLEETDKTQLADFPVDTLKRAQYKQYRTYLRDLPKLFDDTTINTAKVKTFEEWVKWKQGGDY